MEPTEHELDLGWSRLLFAQWVPLLFAAPQLLRHGRDPGHLLWNVLWGLLVLLSLASLVHAWRARMALRLDDVGLRIVPPPPGPIERLLFWSRPAPPPPIPWSEIRAARFETPHATEPMRRVLVLDTPDGERRLVLSYPGLHRLKDPPRLLAALKARGYDLAWPPDPR